MILAEQYRRILARGTERHGECIASLATRNGQGYRYVQYCPSYKAVQKYLSAHRVAYQVWHGPVPDGFHVDHACHNEAVDRGECDGGACIHRSCINPAHLRAVTPGDNFRASGLYRRVAETRKSRTHCQSGHEYTEANTKVRMRNGTPRRECRQCIWETYHGYP